jgi:hypothetical protein
MVTANCRDTAEADDVRTLYSVEERLPGIRQLWSLTLGDPRVCIAVLDGPADLTHPAFDGALVRQLDSLRALPRATGLGLRHGTAVASLIFGQHDGVVPGIAPKCRGVVIPIYGEQEDGALVPCSQLDLARAISLAVAVGANVINISAGVYDETGEPEAALARAIRLCADQGILIVAAAGNEGCACPHVPAASPTVLAVGAADGAGQPAAFSNWPESYLDHGVLAPGESLSVASPQGGTHQADGTSLAAAVVSGVAGLLASWQLRLGQNVDVRAIKTAILGGAVGCEEAVATDCRRWLRGRLDANRAFALISSAGEVSAMSNPNVPQAVAHPNALQGRAGEETPVAEECCAAPAPAGMAGNDLPRGTSVPRSPPFETGRQFVYALGQIAFDFGTEARRDALFQAGGEAVVKDAGALLAFLKDNPWQATAVTWTLQQEETPIYALQPVGPFGRETYERIRELLASQIEEGVTEVSIPGLLGPPIALLNGHQVPVVFPEIRGMFGWSNPVLVKEVLGKRPQDPAKRDEYDQLEAEIGSFLERLYYELSNLGITPQERAVNYAATNLYQVASVYKDAIKKSLKLDKITKERSQVCRPGADCWDVILTLFDPERRYERAREVYRLTIDVSEIIPVTVGKLRRWSVY